MTKAERVFSIVFGAFLLAVGVYALTLDHLTLPWRVVGGLSLCVLGGNLLYAAHAGKRSWLSRIGPLP